MSNVVVLGGYEIASLGDFFRKLAMQADLGEYTCASVALVTSSSGQHTAWYCPKPYNARDTNDIQAATATLQHQLVADNLVEK